MLVASVEWFRDAFVLLGELDPARTQVPQENVA
jgi:hypothetical protein